MRIRKRSNLTSFFDKIQKNTNFIVAETEEYVVLRDRAVLKISDGKNKNPRKIFLTGHFKILKKSSPFGVKILKNPLQLEGAGIDLRLSLNGEEIKFDFASNSTKNISRNITSKLIIDMNVPNSKMQPCGIYPGYIPFSDLSRAIVYCEPETEKIVILPFHVYKINQNGRSRELVLKSNFRVQPDWTKTHKLVTVKNKWRITNAETLVDQPVKLKPGGALNVLTSAVVHINSTGLNFVSSALELRNSFNMQPSFELVSGPSFGSIFLHKYQKLNPGDTFTLPHL